MSYIFIMAFIGTAVVCVGVSIWWTTRKHRISSNEPKLTLVRKSTPMRPVKAPLNRKEIEGSCDCKSVNDLKLVYQPHKTKEENQPLSLSVASTKSKVFTKEASQASLLLTLSKDTEERTPDRSRRMKEKKKTGTEGRRLEGRRCYDDSAKSKNEPIPSSTFIPHLGGKGFENNDGVSCYANSAIQCLFSMHTTLSGVLPQLPFLSHFFPISSEIRRLAFSSLEKTESTERLRKLLPSEYGFAGSVPQCIAEFWEVLFDSVDNEYASIGVKSFLKSPLTEIFDIEYRKYLVCDICRWSQNEDDQISRKLLYLAVPASANREIPFNELLNRSPVDKYCPNKHKLTSQLIFTKNSPFLAVSLNRNESGSKNYTRIVDVDDVRLQVAGESSNLDSWFHDLSIYTVNYKAAALAVHVNSLENGHYFVYRRTPKGDWCHCNDSIVRKIDINNSSLGDRNNLSQMTFLILEKTNREFCFRTEA